MSSDVLTEGARVRVKSRSTSGDPELDDLAGRVGREYRVYDYAGAGQGDDPSGHPYYLLDDDGSFGGSHWAYPDDIEVIQTADEAAARSVPSLRDVCLALSSGLHSVFGSDGMEFNETSIEGEEGGEYVVAFGRTDEGLRFAARIAVLEVWRDDV